MKTIKKMHLSFKTLLFSILAATCTAQISSNHQKYWYYRNELLNKYVVLGKAPNDCAAVLDDEYQGLSIPATSVDHGRKPLPLVKWGDAPETLGMYIGTLVTEYRLLVNSGYNGDKVKEEGKLISMAVPNYTKLSAISHMGHKFNVISVLS
ncbi:MAG: hypothetical protein ACKVOU_13775 [Cytophagales bacterium]